ncbi:MAG: hypothetical protein ACREEM_53045 [Blastocatellia bacterium]
MKSLLVGIKNVLLWSYGRGTWQYDILCLLIVAAILLVPSRYFGDRDRSAQAYDSQEIASKPGVSYRVIEIEELNGFLKKNNREKLATLPQEAIPLFLRDQLKRDVKLVKFEPLMTPKSRIGYRVWFE